MNAEVVTGSASRRVAYCSVALLLYAVVASCGPLGAENDRVNGGGINPPFDGGTSDNGGASDGGFTAQNACALINARKCDYLQRCGLIAQGQPALRDCASILVTTECGPSLWPLRVQVGTLRFSTVIARACAESYPTAHCEDFTRAPELCNDFLTPGAAANGACYGGNFKECQLGVCRGLSCPKLCRPPGTPGEDCNLNQDCATDAGLYCAPGRTSSSGTCSPFAGVDAGCNALTRCEQNLYCAMDGHCQPLGDNGDACSDKTCVSSNWCAIGADGGGVCTWKAVPGTNCTDDRQCQEGSICVVESGKCGGEGPLPRDSACGSRQSCAPGLTCVGLQPNTLGVCSDPRSTDDLCTGHLDCEGHLACVAADGGSQKHCTARREDGAPCALTRECQLYSACRGGTCIRLPRLGEACVSNECVYGSCTESGTDGGRTCTGQLPPNAPCTFDAECSSSRCSAGSCLAACTP